MRIGVQASFDYIANNNHILNKCVDSILVKTSARNKLKVDQDFIKFSTTIAKEYELCVEVPDYNFQIVDSDSKSFEKSTRYLYKLSTLPDVNAVVLKLGHSRNTDLTRPEANKTIRSVLDVALPMFVRDKTQLLIQNEPESSLILTMGSINYILGLVREYAEKDFGLLLNPLKDMKLLEFYHACKNNIKGISLNCKHLNSYLKDVQEVHTVNGIIPIFLSQVPEIHKLKKTLKQISNGSGTHISK